MPSATEVSQVVLSNLGPMTTVFTPPASCATASPQLFLAFTNVPGVLPFYGRDCEKYALGDCFPSGKAIDDGRASFRSSPSLNNHGTLYYLSPASVCPDGHTTVGVAAKDGDGKVSSSGLYVPPVWTAGDSLGREPRMNPVENIFMEALDAGETAVVCCPENFEAGRVDGCYSPVPFSVYGDPITACYSAYQRDFGDVATVNATFTYNHTVVAGEVISYTGGSISYYTTKTETFGPEEVKTNDMGAFEGRAAVTLVYREAGETGSGAAGPTETSPSAAQGWRMTTAGGGVGVLATAWTLAALVGVAVALPW
ncbi:hypothetical protein CkaCkLH20_05615 [Colletotrichum karsti]|uniref:Uncharacterized protein n=1 Tax=Colletotrichum karsti TaxID=1095194 RepID=A0A9P6I5T5_9PEZI|nr:uncharacterized protein CkaCkLH20_05615 [Colletotrichum karsti]KAF9876769.1 hypothetical protein CkaCkLH20_05615 [Colletotrichum karsti]